MSTRVNADFLNFSIRLPARVLAAISLILLAAYLAMALKPTIRLAEIKSRINLEQQIPEQFAGWRIDPNIRPVVPDPGVQAALNALYSQVLTRTYVNSRGERVMLSIAYGSDQSSEATAVHRPEFCYTAQGFSVQPRGSAELTLPTHTLKVQRLMSNMGRQRLEPITYWITLDERASLPGIDRRIEQLRFGLRGEIADGMLVRVSSFGADERKAFELHEHFVRDLQTIVPPEVRSRYFGS